MVIDNISGRPWGGGSGGDDNNTVDCTVFLKGYSYHVKRNSELELELGEC